MRQGKVWDRSARRVMKPAPKHPELERLIAQAKPVESIHNAEPKKEKVEYALNENGGQGKFVLEGPMPEKKRKIGAPTVRPSDLSAPPLLQPGLLDSGQAMRNLLARVNDLTTLYLNGSLHGKTYIANMIELNDSPEWRLAVRSWELSSRSQRNKGGK